MWHSEILVEDVSNPAQAACNREAREHFARNSEWLAAHWHELLPQARGKFVAVAGQEGFVADTPAAGWEWAAKKHPEDKGALVRFVLEAKGPRSYAHHWIVDDVR